MYNFKAPPSIPHCENVGQATVSPAHDSPSPKTVVVSSWSGLSFSSVLRNSSADEGILMMLCRFTFSAVLTIHVLFKNAFFFFQ